MEVLKGRLEAMLAEGDKGLIYAYWMAGQRRREAIRERTREARRGAGGASTAQSVATPLDDVLERMEAALAGERRERAIQEARERAEKALGVEMLASSLKEGARTYAKAYLNRRYGRAS